MPFLFIGIFLLVIGFLFRRSGHKMHEHGLMIGSEHLMYAGIILIIFYGLVYRTLTLFFRT